MDIDWVKDFPGNVTVCDTQGTIVYMNQKAQRTFAADGGPALIGRSLFGCHPEQAAAKLRALLETQQTNVYTIEKNGVKKLIYQAPWFEGGEFAGLVELSLEIPFEMPHFVRG